MCVCLVGTYNTMVTANPVWSPGKAEKPFEIPMNDAPVRPSQRTV